MNIKIRDYEDSDEKACMDIEKENMEIFEGWNVEGSRRAWDNHFKASYRFVVENDTEIIGLIILSRPKEDNSTELMNIQVKKGYQRQGLGSKLLKHTEQWAISKNLSSMTLQVYKDNPVKTLYEKHGFKVEGDGREFNSYLMRKSLDK